MSESRIHDEPTSSEFIIAVDLGGTNLRAASISSDGVIHNQNKARTPRTDQPDDMVRAIIEAVHECGERTTGEGGSVRALSVAVPGTIDARTGTVLKIPNVPSLTGFALGEALQAAGGVPVVLENDANAAAMGEVWQGAARGRADVIMLTLGTGVGGGIVRDGELWRGAHGAAGELGHITVEAYGEPCPCGSRGCLEVYASATAMVRLAREAGVGGGATLTSREVYERAQRGELEARETFRLMGSYLGVGIASLTNTLDPEIVVIGGGAAAGWDAFIEHVRREVQARAFSTAGKNVEIVQAVCGDDAGILGAAYVAFKSLNVSRSS